MEAIAVPIGDKICTGSGPIQWAVAGKLKRRYAIHMPDGAIVEIDARKAAELNAVAVLVPLLTVTKSVRSGDNSVPE